jgi:hypothetical protein
VNVVKRPVITGIAQDLGASGSDGLTNDPTLIISGTSAVSASVEVFKDASSIGTATANSSGSWSFDYTGTSLPEGTYSFTAAATSSVVTVSTASAFSVTIDLTAPGKPTISGIASDTGTSSSDGITNDTTLTVSGTAEAYSYVELYDNSYYSYGIDQADASGNWSVSNTFAAGSRSLIAVATDSAGNRDTTNGLSDAYAITVDTTAPTKPTITGIADDTGSSSTDKTTNDTTLTISGTAEAGTRVALKEDGSTYASGTANEEGSWSISYTFSEGDNYFFIYVTSTDTAGNSTNSDTLTLHVDTAAPTATVVSVSGGDAYITPRRRLLAST